MDTPAIATQAGAHPIWFVIIVGLAFGGLVLLDAVVAVLTGRGLYDRFRDLVARLVSPLNRPMAATPPAAGA